MSSEDSEGPMISDDCSIEAFLKAIEEKDLLEIISFADREATAAWRRAYRQNKCGKIQSELPQRYEQVLEELISFLRAALPYRPFRMDEGVFEQFLKLRRKIFDEAQNPRFPGAFETSFS